MVPIIPMLLLVLRTAEFVFYHLLLSLVDYVSGLPRDMMVPEAMRLYRENIALKAQLEALERHLVRVEATRKRVSLGVRAAQVFAHLLTRGDEPFQRYFFVAADNDYALGDAIQITAAAHAQRGPTAGRRHHRRAHRHAQAREPSLGPAAHSGGTPANGHPRV